MSWQTREKILASLLAAFALALGALIAWILLETQQFRHCPSNSNSPISAGTNGSQASAIVPTAASKLSDLPKASFDDGWIRAARYLRESIDFKVDPCKIILFQILDFFRVITENFCIFLTFLHLCHNFLHFRNFLFKFLLKTFIYALFSKNFHRISETHFQNRSFSP